MNSKQALKCDSCGKVFDKDNLIKGVFKLNENHYCEECLIRDTFGHIIGHKRYNEDWDCSYKEVYDKPICLNTYDEIISLEDVSDIELDEFIDSVFSNLEIDFEWKGSEYGNLKYCSDNRQLLEQRIENIKKRHLKQMISYIYCEISGYLRIEEKEQGGWL